MLGLSDKQWERIREHFPEEHVLAGRSGRMPLITCKVLEAVLWILNAAAVLPELQNGSSPVPTLLPQRSPAIDS